jgi:hypothetical protein
MNSSKRHICPKRTSGSSRPGAKASSLIVPMVSPMEVGVALSLFRSAVADEPAQCPIAPLTDNYVQLCLSDKTLLNLGLGILRIHYGPADIQHPILKRMESFLSLLRYTAEAPDKEWLQFKRRHDRFISVIHAIALCPLADKEPFEAREFMKFVTAAPSQLQVDSNRRN